MRNFKLFNHWIAEVRDIAVKAKLKNSDSILLSQNDIKNIFNGDYFKEVFDEGATPKQAFEEEVEYWED